MSGIDIKELLDQIDMEYWMDREGVDHKITHGSSGTQINLKECPECGDDRWKIYLNADSGLGKCHVCEEGFNKWKIIQKTLDLSGREMMAYLDAVAKEIGWMPKITSTADVTWQNQEWSLPISQPIPINGYNMVYLESRNINIETARYFKLRYSHNSDFFYVDETGKQCAQSYIRRIIIPVFDLDGSLVTFQGRDISGNGVKKYLFPPGIAGSGRYLYNGQNAIGAKRIVVCEGAFDVMAVKVALDQDVTLRDVTAVGTFGKHLSISGQDDQYGRLATLRNKGLEEVTMMWDGSPDAIKDSVDAGIRIKELGLRVKIAILPRDRDPNEVLAEVVIDAFNKAIPLTAATAVMIKINQR